MTVGKPATPATSHVVGDTTHVADHNELATAAPMAVYDATVFGVLLGSSADQTTTINAAISSLAGAGGGTLWFPPGTFYHHGIAGQSSVIIRGAGMHATILSLVNGSNTSSYIPHSSSNGTSDPNAEYDGLFDLTLEGNKANQSGTSHGIFCSPNPAYSQASADYDFDMHHQFERVLIHQALSDGYNATGRSEAHLHRVFAYYSGGHGFNTATDTYFTSCDAGQSGTEGWYITNTNFMMATCKSWYSGAGSGTPAGFHIVGAYGTMASCIAQDNRGQGFLFDGTYSVAGTGLCADSNSTGSPGSYAGFDFYNTDHCDIAGTSVDRYAGSVTNQTYAYKMTTSAGNSIRLTHRGTNGSGVSTAPAASACLLGGGTPPSGNSVVINGTVVE